MKTALREAQCGFLLVRIGHLIRQRYSPCDFMGIMERPEVKSGGSLDFASLLSYNFIYSENGEVLLLSFGMAGS